MLHSIHTHHTGIDRAISQALKSKTLKGFAPTQRHFLSIDTTRSAETVQKYATIDLPAGTNPERGYLARESQPNTNRELHVLPQLDIEFKPFKHRPQTNNRSERSVQNDVTMIYKTKSKDFKAILTERQRRLTIINYQLLPQRNLKQSVKHQKGNKKQASFRESSVKTEVKTMRTIKLHKKRYDIPEFIKPSLELPRRASTALTNQQPSHAIAQEMQKQDAESIKLDFFAESNQAKELSCCRLQVIPRKKSQHNQLMKGNHMTARVYSQAKVRAKPIEEMLFEDQRMIGSLSGWNDQENNWIATKQNPNIKDRESCSRNA